MKKILRLYRLWRYRRLLRKLFWLYAAKTDSVYDAIEQASIAFIWFTNEKALKGGQINYWWFL